MSVAEGGEGVESPMPEPKCEMGFSRRNLLITAGATLALSSVPVAAEAAISWGHPFSTRRGFGRAHGGCYSSYDPQPNSECPPGWGPHRGIDYGAPFKTPIHAIADGFVVYAGNGGRFAPWAGHHVFIRHANDFHSLYLHMDSPPPVRDRTLIKRGQVIGYVGSTGQSNGPHLHVEISTSENRLLDHIDPVPYIQNAPLAPVPSVLPNPIPAPMEDDDNMPVLIHRLNTNHSYTVQPGSYIRHHGNTWHRDIAQNLYNKPTISLSESEFAAALHDLGFFDVGNNLALLPANGSTRYAWWTDEVKAITAAVDAKESNSAIKELRWLKSRIGGSYTGPTLTSLLK